MSLVEIANGISVVVGGWVGGVGAGSSLQQTNGWPSRKPHWLNVIKRRSRLSCGFFFDNSNNDAQDLK